MSNAVQEELQNFVAELIEQSGGLVDWPAGSDRGQAMLTPELARRQGVAEMLPLSSRPGGEGLLVSLASDFLDLAELWLQAVPTVGRFQVAELYLKRGDLGEAVARAYSWLNAKVRVIDSQPTRIEYHTWWFHAVLASEDRWESRLAVTVNAPAAVEVEFPDPFGLWELRRALASRSALPVTTQRPLLPSGESKPWQHPFSREWTPASNGTVSA